MVGEGGRRREKNGWVVAAGHSSACLLVMQYGYVIVYRFWMGSCLSMRGIPLAGMPLPLRRHGKESGGCNEEGECP